MAEPEQACAEYLFVYGTLRQGTRHPLARRLSREAEYLGRGTTCGKLFLIEDYPGLVGSENPDDLVHGDLYRLHPGSALLPQLDTYEECTADYPELNEYLRRLAPITTEPGISYSAWLYLYNRPTGHLSRIDSGDFLLGSWPAGNSG